MREPDAAPTLPMLSPVTYLQFLALFLALPIIVLLVALRREPRSLPWAAIGLVCLLALAYTTPWDNLLVLNGVWSYAPGRVLGWLFGAVPAEEYGFFILQTVLTSLFTLLLWKRFAGRPSAPSPATSEEG